MRFILSLLTIATVLGACRNMIFRRETEDGTVTVKTDLGSVFAEAGKWTKKIEELEKLEPMTIKELAALMPKEIGNFKLEGAGTEISDEESDAALNEDETDMSGMLTVSWINVAYRKGNGAEIELTVQDCAGQGAYMSVLAGSHMNMAIEANDGDFYTKTITFMDGTAIEMVDKKDGSAMLTFMANGRFRIMAVSDNINIEELKEVMKNLKLNV